MNLDPVLAKADVTMIPSAVIKIPTLQGEISMKEMIKRLFYVRRGTVKADMQNEKSLDLRVALCALFVEMSVIDGEFTEKERNTVISVLKQDYGLPDEYADTLIASSESELAKSTDLWGFTRLINEECTVKEKERLIEMAWKIAFADGRLEAHEDYLMHKLANLLHISHGKLMAAKQKAKKAGG